MLRQSTAKRALLLRLAARCGMFAAAQGSESWFRQLAESK